jgi:hypothetical protein
VAGLGPDSNLLRFVRQHCAGKVAFPVSAGGGTSLTLTAEAGLLLPWGARAWATPTSISDRFFLGGLAAGALRGFAHKGVGPSEPRRPVGEVSAICGWGSWPVYVSLTVAYLQMQSGQCIPLAASWRT